MITSYIPFTIVLSDNQIIPVRNIFAFRNVIMAAFNQRDYVMRYTIKTGDTPASLAYFLYGSDRYEWAIYTLNGIVNPYFDWPLSEDDFYEMIEEKYLNKVCLFLNLDSFTNNFVKGETITNGSATGIVDSWDRTLCKITVTSITGTFEADDEITSASSSGTIGRIVEQGQDAVHHFETESGVVLDPYLGYLQAYIAGTNELYALTNHQYEEKLNNSKRQIYVLKPEYIRAAENVLIKNINKIATIDAGNTTI